MKRNPWGLLYTASLVVLLGAFLGIHNVHSATDWPWETPLYLIGAAIFSFHRPKQAFLWAFLLSGSLYVSHVLAIANGYTYPYVEQNYQDAGYCFLTLPITLAGSLIGTTIRWGHNLVVRRHSH